MSTKPKTFDKRDFKDVKYKKDDYRERKDNRNRNFLDRQYEKYKTIKQSLYNENVRKSFEIVNEKMKKFNPKDYIADKYKKFSEKIADPENKKLVKLLPAVFLAVTVLAVKNKRFIKPFIEAFYNAKNNMKSEMSMTDKALFLLYEYSKVLYKNADVITTIDSAISLVTLFLEDIPSIFGKLYAYTEISQFNIQKNIVKNAVELKIDLIDKPQQERKKEEERKKEQKEQQELRDAIKELKSKLGMKDKTKQSNSDISERMALVKSIERLEKARNAKDTKKQGSSRGDKYYSNKGKFTGRR